MKAFKYLPLVAVLALLVLSGCTKTYDDCILDNMEKAHDRAGAVLIKRACEAKYPNH